MFYGWPLYDFRWSCLGVFLSKVSRHAALQIQIQNECAL